MMRGWGAASTHWSSVVRLTSTPFSHRTRTREACTPFTPPCTSWVLAGILMLAGASTTAGQGAYLLAVYSLGMGLPFLAIGLAFDFLTPFLRKINRYSVWIHLISGLMLIVVGILILTNQIFWFQTLIPR